MTLQELLLQMSGDLEGFFRNHTPAPLLRYESIDDLVQGTISRALQSAENFEPRSDEESRAWVFRLARRHLTDRQRHWMALKRDGGKVMRLDWTQSGSSSPLDPQASQTGPSTFALRREQLIFATRALSMLLERDRNLVSWAAEDKPLEEQAEILGLTYRATVVARQRALERYRKTYELVLKGAKRRHE